MTRIFLNKKGDEQVLSIWMFLAWGIIALVITGGILYYNSAKADVRMEQAQVFNMKILSCIQNYGTIDSKFIGDFYKICSLKENIIGNRGFYFNISVVDLDSLAEVFSFFGGSKDFQMYCELKDSSFAQGFPECFKSEQAVLYKDELGNVKSGNAEILTASNNKGKRI